MALTQRDLAHADDVDLNIDLLIQVGNAGIGSSKVKVKGKFIGDEDSGRPKIFKDSFNLNLGKGKSMINKKIEIETKVTPNPAIADKSMIVSYDVTNASFFTGKSRTLKVSASAGLSSETFFVTITIL